MNSPTKFTPKTTTPRPPLPSHAFNPLLASMDKTDPAPVKFQVITREGQDIIVGRVKIPTPGGNHAFILRRFDTGAISLSTMFRASFPTAGEEAEKIDSNWVKANYDLTGANGGGKLRLAGTWVPPALAVHLAPSYSLSSVVFPLAEAQPDASASYRKSSRHTTNGPVNSNMNALSSPFPKTTRGPLASVPESPAPPTKRTKRESASPTRARGQASPIKQAVLPTSVEVPETQEEHHEEAEPDVPGPDMEEDLAESKALIERLKAEKAAAEAKARELAQELNATTADEAIQAGTSTKRGREATPPPPSFNFDREPVDTSERQLVRHRAAQQANRRSAMWGAVMFAVGLGVTSVVPNLFF
ncbi:G/T mismatch-specific thymine DNA glycosylase [Ceratobasidium sp. AG-Ba]|nr:G/T mismatch-specific thymine DNA glycosylase [Ceratobasidium sp. AG-Ba]